MKLLNASLLLNLFIAAITKNTFAAQAAQRYIILHPTTTDPLECLEGTTTADLSQLLEAEDHRWSGVTLTPDQAQNISAALSGQGMIVPDSEIELPFQDTTTDRRLRGLTASAYAAPYLNDYPNCSVTVNGIDVYILDTVLYTSIPNFAGFDIKNEKTYVDESGIPTPCNPHGTEVASIIAGNTNGIISGGNIKLRGIGIFDCNGKGFVADMIRGFQDALNHDIALKAAAANGAPLRRTIVNLSGAAAANPALDAAVTAVYNKGLPIFVAAGNSNKYACNSQSPAQAAGVFAIGSTQAPGDQPALFTNYGTPCIGLYLPGNPVTAIHPISNIKIPVSGTSFSTPIGSGLGAMELARNLSATPDAVYANILDRTVTIPLVGSDIGNSLRVMPAASACAAQNPTSAPTPAPTTQVILTSYNTIAADNNKFRMWRTLSTANALCFKFDARFTTIDGWARIGLRNGAGTQKTIVKIGEFRAKNKFVHTVREGDDVKKATTASRIIYNTEKFKTIRFEKNSTTILISYDIAGVKQQLVAFASNNEYSQVAFSAGGNARVKYSNAITC